MRSTYTSITTLALLLTAGVASAEEPEPWFAPAPAEVAPAPPPNVVTRPDGSASVTRTPDGGVDVHAQTSAGTVHAYECNRVDVDPRQKSSAPAGPCPYPHASPYPYARPAPRYVPMPPPTKSKPKWAPDPARRNALIFSSITFGLGTALTGVAYLASTAASAICDFGDSCRAEPSQGALWAMGAILTVTPSIPRFVVGDVGAGLLYTGVGAGSFAGGVLVDWEDPTYLVPFMFAFVAPLTLGIVNLATTPHREQIEARRRRAANGEPQIQGLGPSVASDYRGNPVPTLGLVGSF
jgi:hypothetical protein